MCTGLVALGRGTHLSRLPPKAWAPPTSARRAEAHKAGKAKGRGATHLFASVGTENEEGQDRRPEFFAHDTDDLAVQSAGISAALALRTASESVLYEAWQPVAPRGWFYL